MFVRGAASYDDAGGRERASGEHQAEMQFLRKLRAGLHVSSRFSSENFPSGSLRQRIGRLSSGQ